MLRHTLLSILLNTVKRHTNNFQNKFKISAYPWVHSKPFFFDRKVSYCWKKKNNSTFILADSMSGRTSCGCCVSFWCLFPALPKLPCGPLVRFVCKTDEWYIVDLWIKDYGQRLRMRVKLMRNTDTSQNTQSVKHNASDPGSFLAKQCWQSLSGGCKCRDCTGRCLKFCG